MPVFEYKALDRNGKSRSGVLSADGPAAARFKLSQDKIYPVEIREVGQEGDRSSQEGPAALLLRLRRVNPFEVTTALRQMATLVSSGLPLVECLNGVVEQTETAGLKRILIQVREKVMEGSSLSQAMAGHPGAFEQIQVNMIRAGEAGGALDAVLTRLADYSEKRRKVKKKIETAMVYPLFLLLISGVIVMFLMTFVMPKVLTIFEGMKLALPWSTRALIWSSGFIKEGWWIILLGVVLISGGFSSLIKTERGGRVWDRIRLNAPLLGRLHRKAAIARFARTFSTLLKSGISLVDSLEIARPSLGNRIMEERMREAAKQVGEGADFATPLKQKAGFPPMVIQLVRAGEKSGDLEGMLAKAAEVYEDELESDITKVTTLIEPGVILLMGALVGFFVMAILLPIFDMTAGIK